MSVSWYLRFEVRGRLDDWNRIKVAATHPAHHMIENFIETAIGTYYHCIPPVYLCYLVIRWYSLLSATWSNPCYTGHHRCRTSAIYEVFPKLDSHLVIVLMLLLAQHSNPSLYIHIRLNVVRRRQCVTYQRHRATKSLLSLVVTARHEFLGTV